MIDHRPSRYIHHDNVKQAMEVYARQTGQLDKLVEWCADPSVRPRQFRPGTIV